MGNQLLELASNLADEAQEHATEVMSPNILADDYNTARKELGIAVMKLQSEIAYMKRELVSANNRLHKITSELHSYQESKKKKSLLTSLTQMMGGSKEDNHCVNTAEKIEKFADSHENLDLYLDGKDIDAVEKTDLRKQVTGYLPGLKSKDPKVSLGEMTEYTKEMEKLSSALPDLNQGSGLTI